MEEVSHVIKVLQDAVQALKEEDAGKLNDLSNQNVHCASCFQDSGTITMSVLIYALSKIIERKDHEKLPNWKKFKISCRNSLVLARRALIENNQIQFQNHIERARKVLSVLSINVRPYIEETFRKAQINKGAKIYSHGISLGQTAKLLGITTWELTEYTGQTKEFNTKYNITLDVRKRAQAALEFFS